MATNFEFYKDEILEITNKDDDFGVVNGGVGGCCVSKCDECVFYICDGLCSSVSKIQWLYAEHVEKPKLTKRERAFCEAVQTGWIARDCDMELCYFKNEPILLKGVWSSQDGLYVSFRELNLQDPFMFIRDTDADCWSVEDLLKLEVEA